MLSALSFCVTSGLAIRSAVIEGKIKTIQSSVAEFQASGSLEYSYQIVDIGNYCDSKADAAEFDASASHISPDNLYDGYLRNQVWQQAETIVKSGACDTLRSGLEPVPQDPRLSYSLAYLSIRSKGDIADPRVTLDVRRLGTVPKQPIWQLSSLPGQESEVPLGQMVKGRDILVPVAIINSEGLPVSSLVTVPLRARWRSPVTKEELVLPLTYVIDREYWRSVRKGVTLSGA